MRGTGTSAFSPNANITRGQFATMLYRYAVSYGGIAPASASLDNFSDGGVSFEDHRAADVLCVGLSISCFSRTALLVWTCLLLYAVHSFSICASFLYISGVFLYFFWNALVK